jgi:hypothetical protein
MKSYRKRITLPSLGNVSVNFYCCSAELYEVYEKLNEFERQKKINHLGLISTEIDGATHTRYEYLMLQCALSDILDKLHKGVAAQGTLKVNGSAYQGNGLLKCWFMLSNLGHLKNTYGDEKTLIQYALRRQGFRSRLLNPIRSIPLKEWCENVIKNFEYHKFHYVIAIHRIYKELRRQVEKQNIIAKFAELLLLDIPVIDYKINSTRLLQLRSLFKKIRDLSIVTIDGHYSHTPLSIDLIASLVSFDEIEGGVFGGDISSSIQPLRKMLVEDIYLNPFVLANQRSFEVAALKSLMPLANTNKTYDWLISTSIHRGIITNHKRDLSPFYRIKIPTEIQSDSVFYDDFRNISIATKRGCPNVEAYLDLNPYTGTRYADFFIDENFTTGNMPRFLFNIATLVTDQIKYLVKNTGSKFELLLRDVEKVAIREGIEEGKIKKIIDGSQGLVRKEIWESAERTLFPSYRNLLWSLITYFVKDNYRIEIEQYNLPYENYAISFAELDDRYLSETLDKAYYHEKESDPDRAHEIDMLRHLTKRKYEGYRIAFLVRIKILDLSQPPEKMIATDIDTALLKISPSSISLELCEAKNKKTKKESTAKKELKELLVPVLKKNATYRIEEVKGYGARLRLICQKGV